MVFSSEFTNKVLEANNLVDFISQHTQLKPTGSGLMGRCPFPDHQEKTPSFSVSETKQVYHCFGCHKKGNLFTFLRDFNGMSFPESVEYLAQRAHIPIPKESFDNKTEDHAKIKKIQLGKINQFAQDFFRRGLKSVGIDHPIRNYLKIRGLDTNTIEEFELGYAPNEWEALTNQVVQAGFLMSLAEEARLVKSRSQGKSGYYDLFRGRLMFPIHNPMGEVVAFGGRILEKNTDEVKYLNSPETPVFTKGKILYGLYKTAKYIRTEDQAIVVEGYMDLVSLYQFGIRNIVASMGTALTNDQCKLIKRMTRNVVVLFDGDSAGQEAAERSLPILLSQDLYPKGLILPENQDPDDFIRKNGVEELKVLLQDKSQDLFFMMLNKWMSDYKGEATEKVKLADKVRPIFDVIPDRRLKELYLNEMAQKLGVSLNWLRGAMSGSGSHRNLGNTQGYSAAQSATLKGPIVKTQSHELTNLKTNLEPSASNQSLSSTQSNTDENSKFIIKGAPSIELTLLNHAIKSRANFKVVMEFEWKDFLTHEGVKKILHYANDVYGQDQVKFDKLISLLILKVDLPELLFLKEAGGLGIASGLSEFDEEKEIKLLKDCFRRVKENALRMQLKKLSVEFKKQPTQEVLEQFQKLQKEISSLLNQNQ